MTQAVTWINAAQTWVFIDDYSETSTETKTGSNINFVSESGSLEFFLFMSSAKRTVHTPNRVQRMSTKLSTISGFSPMPPIHTLGYHFSKWDGVSSDIIIQRSKNFTLNQFPVDVLWMDINWAQNEGDRFGEEYFVFNPLNFTEDGIA